MNNSEKLYIAKEANLRAMLGRTGNVLRGKANTLVSRVKNSPLLGNRGQRGMIVDSKNKSIGGISPYEDTLWGAKGLKGIFQPKLKQLKNAPDIHGGQYGVGGNYGTTNTLKNPMVDTPLAKLLQALGIGAGGGGIGYAGYKGLEADDELGEPYHYRGNPNE